MAEGSLERWLRPRVIFTLLALLMALAVLFAPEPDEGAGRSRLTTYASDSYGARGMYLVLQHLGWPVEQRTRPFGTRLDSQAVYVILDPPIELSRGDVGTLLDAVRRGAAAMVVPSDGSALADSLGVRQSTFTIPSLTTVRDSGAPATDTSDVGEDAEIERGASTEGQLDVPRPPIFHRYLRPLARARRDRVESLPSGSVTLLTVRTKRGPRPAIIGRRMGRGVTLAVADPDFLRNGVVRRGDAAVLAVRLVEWLDPSRRRRIVFDEFHHGFGAHPSITQAIAGALVSTAPGRAVIQLLIAGLLLLLASGVRPIPPAPRTRIERRSPLEHMGALARAYEQVGATRLAAQRLVRGLRRRHALGSTATMDDDAYLDALSAQRPALTDDVAVLRLALRRKLTPAEFVTLGAAIDHIERTIAE